MPRPSQRERVLDAYVDLVVNDGPAGVTLDAVAAAAGVSKGGLLYHFGSKDALLDGFLERVQGLTADDIATARRTAAAGDESVTRYYLRTSADDPAREGALFRSMIALLTLAGAEPRAAQAARGAMSAWRDVLVEETGDELTGDLVAALGDGIYLRAIAGEPTSTLTADWDATLGRLLPRADVSKGSS
jgi:AcrR family transcriptional regulator